MDHSCLQTLEPGVDAEVACYHLPHEQNLLTFLGVHVRNGVSDLVEADAINPLEEARDEALASFTLDNRLH